MRRLNAQDHRWLCIEDLNNPLQIGALIFLDVSSELIPTFVTQARDIIRQRLSQTPWSVRYRSAPLGVDSGAWESFSIDDISDHVKLFHTDRPVTRAQLTDFVGREVLKPLPRNKAPFRVTVFDSLADDLAANGSVAVMIQHHHAVADGIGFQNVLEVLFDVNAQSPPHGTAPSFVDKTPTRLTWLVSSLLRNLSDFRSERHRRSDRERAAEQLRELKTSSTYKRQRTPQIPQLDGPNPQRRTYDFCTLDLNLVRRIATMWNGTVNDVVMTLLGGAVRDHLQSIGALEGLGDESVVALVPRSLRRPGDGAFGNHITMMLPTLGTHIADPQTRFHVVRASMRAEIQRSKLAHEATSAYERPFASRRRLRPESGTSAGNISISNVPGPDTPRWFAGHPVTGNFPTPSLVAGQFLNVTLRRYCDTLDVGVMSEPTKISDLTPIVHELQRSLIVLAQ